MNLRLYILVLTMAAALLGCAEEQDREFAVLVDRDGDGLGQFEDCDDNDPAVTTIAQDDGCGVGQYCAEDGHCLGSARCVSSACVCTNYWSGAMCYTCAPQFTGVSCDTCSNYWSGDNWEVCDPQFSGDN